MKKLYDGLRLYEKEAHIIMEPYEIQIILQGSIACGQKKERKGSTTWNS